MARTIIIGSDQGAYTPNVGTRIITLSELTFIPAIENLAYVINYTQNKTYYAAAENLMHCSISGNDIVIDDLAIFQPLAADDKIHIQFWLPENVQYPLVTDGDSIYAKDIWIAESDMYTFEGSVLDLFNNLHTTIVDNTSNNPKTIFIHFNRTVVSNAVGLGCYGGGNFSNTKIEIVNSGDVFTTVLDDSANNTKYTTKTYQLPITAGFNAIRLTFHTADAVCLSNLIILKTVNVVSRLQAAKPDNTITNINATTGGNLKISLEEIESQISSNGNSQLNTTVYNPNGVALNIDPTTGSVCTEEYSHCEIHEGNHFFIKDWTELTGSQVLNFLAVTSNTTQWIHLVVAFVFELEANVSIYEGTVTSNNGTAITTYNRNRNSVNTSSMLVYHTPTITNDGTVIARYKAGSGNKIGGEDRANQELVLKQNTKYLIRVTNDTALANWFGYLADWYQHTNI